MRNEKDVLVVYHHKYNPDADTSQPWPGVKEKRSIVYNPSVVQNCVQHIIDIVNK